MPVDKFTPHGTLVFVSHRQPTRSALAGKILSHKAETAVVDFGEYEGSYPYTDLVDPREVMYTPHPGAPVQGWDLMDLVLACSLREREIRQNPEIGHICAISEKSGNGEPSVLVFWDENGRIICELFVGDRGCEGAKELRNTYTYDEKGRLATMAQIITYPDGKVIIWRAHRYIYSTDRPDNRYVEESSEHGAEPRTRNYEERLLDTLSERLPEGGE